MEIESSHIALLEQLLTVLVTVLVGSIATYCVYVAKLSRSNGLSADRKLFQESMKMLPSNSRSVELLQERDFLRKFYITDVRPLEQFSEIFSRPENTFHNRRLESNKKALHTALIEFLKVARTADYVGPHEHLYSFLKPNEQDDFTDESPETLHKLESLDNLAKTASTAYLAYLHTGQKTLKL